MSHTTRFRYLFSATFTAVVIVALVGWLQNRDVTELAYVLGLAAAACGIGEAANVGKRATFKPEAGPPGN